MKLRNILKPKSKKQIFDVFISENKLSAYNLNCFLKVYNTNNMIKLWILSIFVFIFSLSLLISGIVSMTEGYFWFPFAENSSNMFFIFVNIFWGILWFALDIFMIVFMIGKLINASDE